MHALFEAPSAGGLDVGIFVIAVVLDLVGIAAETDHQHVDGARCPLRRWCDDVVHIEMMEPCTIHPTFLQPRDPPPDTSASFSRPRIGSRGFPLNEGMNAPV